MNQSDFNIDKYIALKDAAGLAAAYFDNIIRGNPQIISHRTILTMLHEAIDMPDKKENKIDSI
jgi:hypothetical protein